MQQRLIDDRFELLSVLGEGAYGEVHKARDHATGRDVALKILKQRPDKPGVVERFLREGELTARLQHPGILRVHSAGTVEGRPYLACELVEGSRELDQAFEGLELVERVELIAQAALALGHAHRTGIVHRDIKPANILVDRHGRTRVADFGLAQAWDSERLTRTGAVVGTPLYLSPEQVQGHEALPPSDVWALGLLLYEALTGELPWDAQSIQALMGQILQMDPVPPRKRAPDCPRGVEAVCLKALQKDPQLRYPDATAFAQDLERALAGESVQAARTGNLLRARSLAPLAAVALTVAALAIAVLGAGSGAVTIRWADPKRRDWGGEGPVELAGTVINAPGECVVRVGDRSFPVADGRFAAPLDLPDGDHRLEVKILENEEVIGHTTRTVHVDRTPPKLTLSTPEDALTQKQALSFSGAVDDGGAPVRVRVDDQEKTLTARFVFDLALKPGRNVVEVVATDTLGNRAQAQRTLWRVPLWYQDLAPADRAPLPLPPGVDFGEGPGEYLNASDGSVLVWVTRPKTKGAGGIFPIQLGKRYALFPEGYYLGKHEVTRAQYLRFCEESGRRPPQTPSWQTGPRHPIGLVSWFDAVAYCKWAGLRLPSEAEWEYAAMSLDGRTYPWGFVGSRGHGNFSDADGHLDVFEKTAPVGSFPKSASPFGALDMGGNVLEWVHDWDGAFQEPLDRTPVENFSGPARGVRKVIRGGGYDISYKLARCLTRHAEDPNRILQHTGFRVARSAR